MSYLDRIKDDLRKDIGIKENILKPSWQKYLDSNFVPKIFLTDIEY